jgi:hypothetical protein
MRLMPPQTRARITLAVSLCAAAGIAVWAWLNLSEGKATPTQSVAGHLDSEVLQEASGLACSLQSPDLFWTHNDSGGQPVLYAIDSTGHFRGSVRLAGVKNVDWEDIASFTLDGRAWLLVADVGDNNANRHNCMLHVIAEPDPAMLSARNEILAAVAWSIPIRYARGPRDCEAVAVDPVGEKIYLLSKRTRPPEIFEVPLRLPADHKVTPLVALAPFTHIPKPSNWDRLWPVPTGRYRAEPTGMSIAPDGRAIAVLTYGQVLLLFRQPGQRWIDALTSLPEILPLSGIQQAEGIGFSRDSRSLFVTGEQKGAPLLRYRLRGEP